LTKSSDAPTPRRNVLIRPDEHSADEGVSAYLLHGLVGVGDTGRTERNTEDGAIGSTYERDGDGTPGARPQRENHALATTHVPPDDLDGSSKIWKGHVAEVCNPDRLASIPEPEGREGAGELNDVHVVTCRHEGQ